MLKSFHPAQVASSKFRELREECKGLRAESEEEKERLGDRE